MVKKISILGLTYRVNEVEVVNKNIPRNGEINFIEQVIKIDKTLSEERKQITLLHEIIHGICEQLQFNEIGDNEQMVQGFALALHQILKDGFTFS
jgi:Zn-dependent peptidase ImmA (M78 family)